MFADEKKLVPAILRGICWFSAVFIEGFAIVLSHPSHRYGFLIVLIGSGLAGLMAGAYSTIPKDNRKGRRKPPALS